MIYYPGWPAADLLREVLVDRTQADAAACGHGDVRAADIGNLLDVGAAGDRIGGGHRS